MSPNCTDDLLISPLFIFSLSAPPTLLSLRKIRHRWRRVNFLLDNKYWWFRKQTLLTSTFLLSRWLQTYRWTFCEFNVFPYPVLASARSGPDGCVGTHDRGFLQKQTVQVKRNKIRSLQFVSCPSVIQFYLQDSENSNQFLFMQRKVVSRC